MGKRNYKACSSIFLYTTIAILFLCAFSYRGLFANETALDELLGRFKRPITFLAVGDDCEQLLNTLAQKHEGVFVLLSENEPVLKPLPTNVVHLKAKGHLHTLRHIGECEHFDVAFVSVKSGVLTDKYLKILSQLGEHVVLSDYPKDANEDVLYNKYGFFPMEYSQSAMLPCCLAQYSKNYLKRTQWLEPASKQNCVRQIVSTYTEKTLSKNHLIPPAISLWKPGINLMTFKMLSGSYPDAQQLEQEICRLYFVPHLDWMPNNIVVQGSTLELIDFDDPRTSQPKTVHTEEMLSLMLRFVQEPSSKNIPALFKEILEYNKEQIHPKVLSAT